MWPFIINDRKKIEIEKKNAEKKEYFFSSLEKC